MRGVPSILVAGAALACSSSAPTDIAGEYNVNDSSSLGQSCVFGMPPDPFTSYWATDHFSGSGLANNTVPGALRVSRDGDLVQVTVEEGALRDYLDLMLGTATFTGTLTGGQLDATIVGIRTISHGTCLFSVDAHLTASFGSLLLSAERTVPTLDGIIVSAPRTTAPACGFDVCRPTAFRHVLFAVRLD